MKKLLLGAAIVLCASFSAKAQTTIMYQNFNGLTTAPAGWTQDVKASNEPDNLGWEFGNTFPTGASDFMYEYIAPHGYYTFVDDADYNYPADKNNFDTLYMSSINCSAYAHVFLSFDAMFWIYSGEEKASVIVSSNGGTTWSTAANLVNISSLGENNWVDSLVFDISAYAGGKPNVIIALAYDDECATSGYPTYGIAIANIDVFSPLAYDLSAVQSTTQYITTVGTPITFTGTEFNWGGDSIVSMNMNYNVNGGAEVTTALTGLSFKKCTAYNFSLGSNQWTPSAAGNYLVRFWADNLNGSNVDMNNANDTLYAYFTVVTAVQPKQALFEEFMQASCDPCMYAGPNIEPVLHTADTGGYCNSFRYHTDWPDTDYMNDETQAFVGQRVNYYGVDGVPDGKIDGTTDVDPASVSDANIKTAANIGAPATINITSCTYDPTTSTYALSANVKSYADFPEGIIARVMLSVDTIKYDSNQSVEDPTADFAPPLGTTSGGIADSYYTYVKNFAQVGEEMLPDYNGTTLGSFTIGQTQTVNVSWVQNHPWGEHAAGENWHYDSTFPGEHMTVFLQEDQAAANTERPSSTGSYPTHGQSGALTTYVYQSASAPVVSTTAGIEKLANGVYFELFPNPASTSATIEFALEQAQNVKVDVYNTLGENVYSVNEGSMESGQHSILINGQELKSGMYFVRFTTDNASTTKKLIIQH